MKSSESSLILDVFPSWVPLRAIHRAITEIIYRAIYTILDDHKIDNWTKSRPIYHKIIKIVNIEDLRGHNVNVGQNNDIYGNITLLLLVGNFVRSIKGNWHFR